MRASTKLKLSPEHAWQMLIDVEAQQAWMGSGGRIRAQRASRVCLAHEAGVWRSGTVAEVQADEHRLHLRIDAAQGWSDWDQTRVSIAIKPKGRRGSQIVVTERNLCEDAIDDAEAYWEAALERLRVLCAKIQRRRKRPRQAVIVVHGIGEQKPGETLHKFVETCIGPLGQSSRTKPDWTSSLFELRRVNVDATDQHERPNTDVYELYWAHIIRDTTLGQIAAWAQQLLFRRGIPRRFLGAWAAVMACAVAAITLIILRFFGLAPAWADMLLGGGAVAVVAVGIWRVFGQSFVLNSLGDAARYLTPRPDNIAHRQAVREAGVELLEKLHQSGRFDRIVVLGHSLGSVIAYDIITHYWIRTYKRHIKLPVRDNQAVEDIAANLDEDHPILAQRHQHAAWHADRANGKSWLITDLVTIGSPLSAADFLITADKSKLDQSHGQREMPKCPPAPETITYPTDAGDPHTKHRVSFDADYTDRFGQPHRTISLFHHAAPFAVTRWTNLYFDNALLKDPIGGPVSPLFGKWVRDVALPDPRDKSCFLHSHYWRGRPDDVHVKELNRALQLVDGAQLLGEMEQHSPLLYLHSVLKKTEG